MGSTSIDWQENGLVFTSVSGTPIDSKNLTKRYFKPLLKKAGLPDIRFHDLRHTAATLLIGQGANPRLVADILGHSRVGTTLEIYGHVTYELQRAAMEKWMSY